jgi:DNA-binding MarR family transcriptional regulator
MSLFKLEPMKKSQMPWIALRGLLDELASATELKKVDEMSRKVFDWIYSRHQEGGTPIFVQTVVMESDVASPASIHKSLAVLERADFISVEVDPTDARRRIVSPTERGHKLIKELSKAVTQWAAQSTSLAKSASRERSPR